MKNGVTLLEVLIVIIIIGILASIAVPNFTNRIERTRGERAIANLEVIKDAWRMYHIRHDPDYYFCTDSEETGTWYEPANNLSIINQNLHLEIVDNNFEYNIHRVNEFTSGGNSYYFFFARRVSGPYNLTCIGYAYRLNDGEEGWIGPSIRSPWPWHPTEPSLTVE